MWHIVQDSKWQAETISIILSFSDVIQPGDSIVGTPTITITVLTGQDSNPSNLLYEGVTVYSGVSVEQRFRLGLPGNIYQILYKIVTVAGDTFEKDCYLAILPDEDSAVPNYLPLLESTNLYPYEAGPDSIKSAINWIAATLIGYKIPAEYIESFVNWQSATLITYGSITYAVTGDYISSSPALLSGTLVIYGSISYSVSGDGISSNAAMLSGTLVGTGISYHNPYESIQSSVTFVGGTLSA